MRLWRLNWVKEMPPHLLRFQKFWGIIGICFWKLDICCSMVSFLCFQVSLLQLTNSFFCPVIKATRSKIRVLPLLFPLPTLSYNTANCADRREDCSACKYVGFAFMSLNFSSFPTKDSIEDAKGSRVPQALSNCGHMWDCWCYIFIWKGRIRFKRSWSCPFGAKFPTR